MNSGNDNGADSHVAVSTGSAKRKEIPSFRWLRWLLLILVAATIGCYAIQTTAEFSLTGRPTFDMVGLLGFANLFWYMFVRTYPGWSSSKQIGMIAMAIVLQGILFATWRMDGAFGNGRPNFVLRWNPTSADRPFSETAPSEFQFNDTSNPMWSGFRGSDRSGSTDSVQMKLWAETEPKRIWGRPVGSAWSSFAIADTVCITQEQRGEFESVVCYELATGKQLWEHQNPVRFSEVTSGDGPRATPTIDGDLVFAFGATGILNCRAVRTGKLIWSRDVLEENQIENRNFGMTGSPLVLEDQVVVAPGGKGTAVVCYRRADGNQIWSAGDETASYSSPQFAKVCGVPAVLCLNGDGLSCYQWSDGKPMFHIPWTSGGVEKNNVCQPIVVSQEDQKTRIFISSGYGRGAAVYEISTADGECKVRSIWKNTFLKSKFASAVTKDDHVYGLDNGILTCLSLQDGRRMWKQGRYGHGQLIRIGNYLIILSERGDLAQVECDPSGFSEIARLEALQDRTWNHPAFNGQYLLVRNDQEAICFEVPLESVPGPTSKIAAEDHVE